MCIYTYTYSYVNKYIYIYNYIHYILHIYIYAQFTNLLSSDPNPLLGFSPGRRTTPMQRILGDLSREGVRSWSGHENLEKLQGWCPQQ